MTRPSRFLKKFAPGIAAGAAIAVIAIAPLAIARHDGTSPRPSEGDPTRQSFGISPTVNKQGGVRYEAMSIPGGEGNVVSAGVTATGLAITYAGEAEGGNVARIFGAAGTELGSFNRVVGIALSDPTGNLAVFLQDTTPESTDPDGGAETDTSPGVPDTFAMVAVNTSTGAEISRIPVSAATDVWAVGAGRAAIGDGLVSRLWTPGQAPQVASFVPSRFYIVGVTADRIIATNFDAVTMIFDLAGQLITQVGDLVSWSASQAADALAGATASGLIATVDLTTGLLSLLDPGIPATTASYSEDGDSLLVNSESSLVDPDAAQYMCPAEPDAICEPIDDGGVAFLPNEAFGQFISQSA